MAEISGVALGAIAVGAVFVYGGLSNKSPLQALLYVVQGKNPSNAITQPGITDASGNVYAGATAAGSQSSSGGAYGWIDDSMKSWGFTKAGRAGALGNLQVESGFSPTSLNPGEGAIGIANWEGGRRTALQAFAAARGTTETDGPTQLAFMKHELDTSKLFVFAAMKIATDPGNAAAIWDANYEGSSGAARQERIDNAIRIYGALK